MSNIDPQRLAEAACDSLGIHVRVEDLHLMPGGAFRETWSFDAVAEDASRMALVARRDPPGRPSAPGQPGLSQRGVEANLLRAAARAGVPVPTVRFDLPADLGEGFVMDRVDGETLARRILRDDNFAGARPKMAAQCGEILARLHTIDTAAVAALPAPAAGEHPAEVELRRYEELLDLHGEPHPALELGLRWLSSRLPRPRPLVVVHGDFRNGNFIVGPEGIRAVLDWELAHIGDPMEDLGWLCVKTWRFGHVNRPVGGFGDREELFAAYEAAGGLMDREAVRFWEIFGNVKWGVVCIVQAFTHLNGLHRSVELAALGRRTCEVEHDLLELLAEVAP